MPRRITQHVASFLLFCDPYSELIPELHPCHNPPETGVPLFTRLRVPFAGQPSEPDLGHASEGRPLTNRTPRSFAALEMGLRFFIFRVFSE